MKYNKLIYNILVLFLVMFLPNNIINLPQEKHDFISANLLKVGTPAPYFEGINIDGETIKFFDYKGKLILLDWWYVGCKPCIKSMNDIQKIHDELGQDSFTIIGMNPISRRSAIKRFERKHNYNHEVLIPNSNIKDAYKIRAYPTLYLIGRDGKILFARAGYSAEFTTELKQLIKEYLQSNP